MKKITYILIACFLLNGFSANAQKKFKKERKERIRALKIAHITDKLDLTEKEAQKFWPIYNKFDKQLMELRIDQKHKLKKSIEASGGIEMLSESQAKETAQKMILFDKSSYEIKQNLFMKLSGIIPYKKILKLQIAEGEFNRKLIRKLRKKRKPLKEKKGSN